MLNVWNRFLMNLRGPKSDQVCRGSPVNAEIKERNRRQRVPGHCLRTLLRRQGLSQTRLSETDINNLRKISNWMEGALKGASRKRFDSESNASNAMQGNSEMPTAALQFHTDVRPWAIYKPQMQSTSTAGSSSANLWAQGSTDCSKIVEG